MRCARSITVIMVNRLTINLRESSDQAVRWPSASTGTTGFSSWRVKSGSRPEQTQDSDLHGADITSIPMHTLPPEKDDARF